MSPTLRMPVVAAAVAAALLVIASAPAAHMRQGGLQGAPVATPMDDFATVWQALEIRAVLDRDGVLHATELVTIVTGARVTSARRMFRTWVDARATVASVACLDPATGEARPLAAGQTDTRGQYSFEYGMLQWDLRPFADEQLQPGVARTYRIDYTVAGSVIPIWGVRGFGTRSIISFSVMHPFRRAEELWKGWGFALRHGPGLRLLDFDFSPFPFKAGAPIGRVSLDLSVGPAWRIAGVATRPGPRPVASDEDIRDFLPLEFVGGGSAPAVHAGSHALWLLALVLGPIACVSIAGLHLRWMLPLARRFSGMVVDADWIRANLLTREASEVRRLASETEEPWHAPGPKAKAGSASHGAGSAIAGFLRRRATIIFVGLGVVLCFSSLEGGGFFALATGLVLGSLVMQLMGLALDRAGRSLELSAPRLWLLAFPVTLFSAIIIGFFLIAYSTPRAIAGLALLSTGFVNALVNSTRPGFTEEEMEYRHGLAGARRYILDELGKPRPAIDDDWMPWIETLGLGDAVKRWKEGKGMFSTRLD